MNYSKYFNVIKIFKIKYYKKYKRFYRVKIKNGDLKFAKE
jgi:hypothetical protein